MKIYISVISNRNHNPMFVGSLYALTQHLTHRGKQYGVQTYAIGIGTGHSCLSRGRQEALDTAIKNGYTHLLFLDDDMVFEPNIVEVMIGRNVPVIGANAVLKTAGPIKFVARTEQGARVSSTGKTGIEEVYRTGTGIMLIAVDPVRNIARPHFEVIWHPEKKDYISEDSYFCDKLRAHNIPIHIDHDVSQTVGHVGDYIYAM